ncbi:MAG: DMT family transporter [Holosporales bacterium]|nr:DMT family transporter [Holosporales bacterium]
MSETCSQRRTNYLGAAVLLTLLNFLSSLNDVLAFYIGQDISPIQIAFCRFVVTVLSVLPFMLPKGLLYFKTRVPLTHLVHSVIGAIALGAVTFSVVKLPLLKNTCILFSEPLVLLPLAAIFFKEKIDFARWSCAIIGFIGIVVITYKDIETFNLWIWVPLLSALSFAAMTLIARQISVKQHALTILFYFGLGTSLVFLIPAILVWKPLSALQLALVTIIGINGNLMQLCLYQSFKIADISGFIPLRYTEMLFTFLLGYYAFGQVPKGTTIFGGVIIIVSAIVLTTIEQRKERRQKMKNR